jgi:hypothetical protein
MTFTTTPPTTPGFYAWRKHALGVPVAAIVSWNSKLSAFNCELSDASVGSVDRMNGEWCRLVPAEEVEKAIQEYATAMGQSEFIIQSADRWWNDSRAKRVMEGHE